MTTKTISELMNSLSIEIITVKRIASILEALSDQGYSNACARANHDGQAEWEKQWWSDVDWLRGALAKAAEEMMEMAEEVEDRIDKIKTTATAEG